MRRYSVWAAIALDTDRAGLGVVQGRTRAFAVAAGVGELDHLGLGNRQAEKPPPPRHERLRVAEPQTVGLPQEWEELYLFLRFRRPRWL